MNPAGRCVQLRWEVGKNLLWVRGRRDEDDLMVLVCYTIITST